MELGYDICMIGAGISLAAFAVLVVFGALEKRGMLYGSKNRAKRRD